MVPMRGFRAIRIVVQRRYSSLPRKPHKPKTDGNTGEKFETHKCVSLKGGCGGNGMQSFTSVYRKEFNGPDGGDGGNGGHVIFKANGNYRSLNHIQSTTIKADSGTKGQSKYCQGKNADHVYVEVPCGTMIKDEEGRQLISLDADGQYYIGARGGAGGKGNYFFLSNENRAPLTYEEGAQGEQRRLNLELRIMAHAGLVGFPNAGKSTFLRAISRARPKVASYPFTTLNPHVGIVEYEDYVQISVADIPGLIEGAHENRGLGFSFLCHIERCVCLLYVIDMSEADPWEQLEKLQYELEQYEPGLSQRPHAVIGNKMDLPGAKQNLSALRDRCKLQVFPVSAKEGLNIQPVLVHLRELYDRHKVETPSQDTARL